MTEANAEWYVPGDGDQLAGPLTAAQVLDSWKADRLTEATVCWREGMADWRPIGEVQPFASAIRRAQAVSRRRRRRIGIAVAAVAVVVATTATVYVLTSDPPAVRHARKLIDAGAYDTAVRILEPFHNEKPANPKAAYLLALARLNDYASTTSRRPNDRLQQSKKLFQTAFSLDATWMDTAKTDLARSSSLVPEDVPDAVTRTLVIARLRHDLHVGDPKQLAQDVLNIASTHPESSKARRLSDEVAMQVLSWDPSLAGEIIDLALPAELTSRTELTQRVTRLRSWAADRPSLAEVLPAALLERADALLAAGEYDTAEVLLKAAGQIQPDLLSQVAHKRLRYLKRLLVDGDTAHAQRILNGTKRDSDAMRTGAVKLYLEMAKRLRDTDRAAAKKVLDQALELAPAVAGGEEVAWLRIELAHKPDQAKLQQCREFLGDFPKSRHRAELLMIVVRDSVAKFGRRQANLADQYGTEALAAAHELMQAYPQTPDLDGRILALARQFADKKQCEKALPLLRAFLSVTPDTIRLLEIDELIARCREKEGKGTLPREFDELADRVEKELASKMMTLVLPEAVRHLADRPEVVSVVEVAPGCTKDKFNSEQSELLRAWVRNGGVLWVNNDVLSFFRINYKRSGGGHKKTMHPGVAAEVHPVLTGCKSAKVSWRRGTAYDLRADGVIPLLGTENYTIWSLAPYGNGWVSDVKDVDVNAYDGARFWLNFRLFCLDWEIPGGLPGPAAGPALIPTPSPTPVREVEPTAVTPPHATPKTEVTVVSTAGELNAAIHDIDLQRVIWVRLSKKNVSSEATKALLRWVRKGGVIWLETDLARSFGIARFLDPTPAGRKEGWADILTSVHPIVDGVKGRVPYTLSFDQPVITGNREKIEKAITPLLGWNEQGNLVLVCGIRDHGEGLVVYRPHDLDPESERGRRFEENLRAFSLQAARHALSMSDVGDASGGVDGD